MISKSRKQKNKVQKSIAICGGIAVGKTTFGKYLAEALPNSQYFAEDVDENQFLVDFYQDMKTWGFHSRISFLAMKAKIYRKIAPSSDYVIFDRPLHELITFAKLQYDLGSLEDRDFQTYLSLYETFVYLLPKLDFVYYLHCSSKTSLDRIHKRGRPFEQHITTTYLENIQYYYEEWIDNLESQKVIRVNTDNPGEMNIFAIEASKLLKHN